MINIDDIIGVPYKTHGRNKHEGFDCFGLLIEVEKRFGHDIPEPKEVFVHNNFNECVASYEDIIPIKKTDEPKESGDIVIIKIDGLARHVGCYFDNGMVLHCNKNGVHFSKLKDIDVGSVYTWQK